ncbi:MULTISPECIES: 2-oxoglutarate dehydrogenase complex dihydrolipoyllysine-residue succinyltransferase [Variovorax]|jgi:2-oxoglutarate dehydrogenase E2 component (dihydrolipoamide succinyltransferase)|uniref:2-oxoglutarate dehydrogenase complex dihydrolipoyllysine-residue succinyltransferase n=1 Tax=Variovorax TaxID=34072 RepID=UPI00086F2CBE|nr:MULTISPECIES: 2-oxoglutarate dehydrogenase complex dihydrolipoyllysine-residue succinyltransferase [Variovorax]MBN8753135.1 2-oxoglutarate dehydrogenase complex dihydrolipoyllysine-residue succinyltransferase [Variovorax sp.]ODU11585.1 MAG: dihydrolipoamide succinyltransferase [Variovorax sp. SCN 67-85]ODV15050.1 MAG: dihydrolipoamide succinyltransferase [Variovorax sp. SCN 67-20]OJZ12050.1 MAG: dihydrolipoamide succinyltransferase [Variovorax sp. 67-131]UKI05337.1 2-oxoglutarate dehydrogen
MSIVEVKVPQLSESVAEATMLTWKKKAGEAVAVDEILIEIETDKVVLEVPAPSAGVLAEIVQPDGATVVAEQLIAKIDTEGKASAAAPAAAAAAPAAAPAAAAPASAAAATGGSKADVAMPAAAKLLADNNLKTSDVAGTGKDGRVTKGDVLGAVASGAKPAAPAATIAAPAAKPALPQVAAPTGAPDLGERPEQRVPMSRLRARIAERLLQSQSTNAILTTFNEVNMAPVMELRKRFQDSFTKEHGVKLGFMSFFVKAAVHALKKYPVINASVDGNDILYHGYFDIGIAVGSPRGLVVPILRNADQMSFADIEKKIAEFGKKAQDGKLGIEDMTGGTFSISNGGTFGSMLSTPIINPPQSAILGVHATKDRAVVENGQIVIRPMNYLAMSYDHRIIDGREAVLGLVAMKEALEDPSRLLFDI